MKAQARTLRWWAALVLLLMLTFALRVWQLPQIPPGITHDEASNGHDSAAILEGEHRIYFPVGYGHEPLYNYSVAAATALLGQSIFTLRITTVAWSMVQVILTVSLARRWWGRPAALGVAAAYAANFWSLMMARVGLRAPALPALLAASVLSYAHAIELSGRGSGHTATHPGRTIRTQAGLKTNRQDPRTGSRRRAAGCYGAAGLFLGASLYTYMASRGMPLLYVVFLIALALLNRRRLEAVWQGTVAVLLVAAVVSAPLFIYLYRNPDLEQRIGQLGAAITALWQGDWGPIARNILDSLPMLFFQGDPQWLYNVAGRPGLEPLLSLLFVLGLIAAIRNLRREPVLLTLIWLVGGLAPALLVARDYNLLHAIAAMPAVLLLVGAGLAWLIRAYRSTDRISAPLKAAVAAAGVLAFAATTAGTAYAYFQTWSANRNVRVAYHHHVVTLGRLLQSGGETEPVLITSLYPGEHHDPYVMEVTLGQRDADIRWSDGRTALFVPAETARLFIEEQTQPNPTLWQWTANDLTPTTTLAFRKIDIPSRTDGYIWEASTTWQRLVAQTANRYAAAPGDPPLAVAHNTMTGAVRFGETVSLVGYRFEAAAQQPSGNNETDPVPTRVIAADGGVMPAGSALTLMTIWEVHRSTPQELAVFAHLLTADGVLAAQDDRLDAPSWQWQPGDRWVQIHSLSPAEPLPPGHYVVALGLYDRRTSDRLPVATEPTLPAPGATRILVPLEIVDP